jgi:hypothetical protein
MVDLAKGSVKERGRAARGLVGLTAPALETDGPAGRGGCGSERIFTGLRCAIGGSAGTIGGSAGTIDGSAGAIGGSAGGTGGSVLLRGSGAGVRKTNGVVLGEPWGCWAGARSLGGGRLTEVRIVGATLVELAGLNREPERDLACWMAGPKRLEVRSVIEAGSEGVGLREGPRMSSRDVDVGTVLSSRVGWGVGVAEADERKA